MSDALPSVGRLGDRPWSVAILASREEAGQLLATVSAVRVACRKPTVIDLLINGNRSLAVEVGEALGSQRTEVGGQNSLRVWFLPLGDKANTWNWYVHRIWSGGRLTYFVDGYVMVAPDALELLERACDAVPDALASTGIPSRGRSARLAHATALREGHLHGNLFAVKQSTMEALRRRRIRLPLGLYGYDGLIGAFFAFGLDPSANGWDLKARVAVAYEATWTHEEGRWWRLADFKGQLQRLTKQALRDLVVRAVRDFLAVRRRQPEDLPRTTAELVISWAERHPEESHILLQRSPLHRSAFRRLQAGRDWSLADAEPELAFEAG